MTPAPRIDHMLRAILRTDFASFVRKCAILLSPGQRFLDNWHIHAMAHALEEVRLRQVAASDHQRAPSLAQVNHRFGGTPGLCLGA